MVTRTPDVDTTTLPSTQTMDRHFRRELPPQNTEIDGTQTPTFPRPNTTLTPNTQYNKQEEDIIDTNDNFSMSPQKFDTIIQDTNNKRSAEVNTSISLEIPKK